MENLNSPHELDRLKTKVLQQLQTLQGAPGVQMMEVRPRCVCVHLQHMYFFCSETRFIWNESCELISYVLSSRVCPLSAVDTGFHVC